MSLHRALLLLTLALTAPDGGRAGLIFGGKVAAPHSRPYMVLVERKMPNGNTKYCGGFLLREDFVLTAAHCKASSYNVFLGLHDNREPEDIQKIPVGQTFMREDYDPDTLENDLLLLKLSTNAKLTSSVKTIAVAGLEDAAPQSCSVAGWGSSEKHLSHMTPVLMEVNITLSSDCEEEAFYCCISAARIGRGDSGGPLVCEDGKVYGVVSGLYDKEEYKVHLFAKIPKHKEWIDSIIKTVALTCCFG